MATAEEYAQWIVSNADKKGTPEFDTVAQAYEIAKQQPAVTADNQPMAASQPDGFSVGKMIGNIPQSGASYASSIYEALRHPADTAKSVLDLAAGGLQNALPESVVSAGNAVNQALGLPSGQPARVMAGQVGEFYKNRYGSSQGALNTIQNDPIGALGDLATILGGGGAAITKVPALSKAGRLGTTAAKFVDPASLAYKGASVVSPYIGSGVANVIGGLGTHTGGESLKQAAKAGAQGGEKAQVFLDNLRGNVPATSALDQAKAAVETMGQQKSAQYRSGMVNIKNDKTILDFNGIDKAITDVQPIVKFKSQVKNAKSAQVLDAINSEINLWKSLDPAEYHTPEGLDALKQKIGGIVDSIPFEEKTARLVGQKLYGAVKDSITAQAPTYSKVMKQYADSTEQIREIERALSLGQKASADTAMRKLQSLTRNNANTNYGNRLELAKQLEQSGAPNLMSALSGQALSAITPRGLGGLQLGGTGALAYLSGNAAAIPLLAAQSPRLMGEAAYYAGKAGGKIGKSAKAAGNAINAKGIPPELIGNILYQANQPKGLLGE